MVRKRVLVRAAALAALAAAGVVRAENGTSGTPAAAGAQYSGPIYMVQEQPPQVPSDVTRGDQPKPDTTVAEAAAKPETPPRPLMALLDGTSFGDALKEARINIFGHAEASWTHNFSSDDRIIVGRVFDLEHDDPTFNQLDLTVERSVVVSPDQWDLGGRVEWIWGGDARLIHSVGLFDHYGFDDGPDNQFDLNQAYVDVNVPLGKGLRVRAGKFVTLLGQEVINPIGNALYSHSYLFGYAIPFTHTGVLGTYALSDKVTTWLDQQPVGERYIAFDENTPANFTVELVQIVTAWATFQQFFHVTNLIMAALSYQDQDSVGTAASEPALAAAA